MCARNHRWCLQAAIRFPQTVGPIPTVRYQITTSGYSVMQSMAPDVAMKDGYVGCCG